MSWLFVVLATGIMACSGKEVTAPESVAGTSSLQRIDGASLPSGIFSGQASDTETGKAYRDFIAMIESGKLELDPDGQHHATLDYRLMLGGVPQRTDEVMGSQLVPDNANVGRR